MLSPLVTEGLLPQEGAVTQVCDPAKTRKSKPSGETPTPHSSTPVVEGQPSTGLGRLGLRPDIYSNSVPDLKGHWTDAVGLKWAAAVRTPAAGLP